MSGLTEVNCICCGLALKTEPNDNPMVIFPVYDGLIFRATGNFGSTVFDPMSFLPGMKEQMLQVIICDECMKVRAKRVTRLCNIKSETTADRGEFLP